MFNKYIEQLWIEQNWNLWSLVCLVVPKWLKLSPQALSAPSFPSGRCGVRPAVHHAPQMRRRRKKHRACWSEVLLRIDRNMFTLCHANACPTVWSVSFRMWYQKKKTTYNLENIKSSMALTCLSSTRLDISWMESAVLYIYFKYSWI